MELEKMVFFQQWEDAKLKCKANRMAEIKVALPEEIRRKALMKEKDIDRLFEKKVEEAMKAIDDEVAGITTPKKKARTPAQGKGKGKKATTTTSPASPSSSSANTTSSSSSSANTASSSSSSATTTTPASDTPTTTTPADDASSQVELKDVRTNSLGQIISAMKFEIMKACGLFNISARPGAKDNAEDVSDRRERWQLVLRWMAKNSEFIPKAVKQVLCSGSSVEQDADPCNPAIVRTDEIWTQERRFFWHALDCVCFELVHSVGESLATARKARTEWKEKNPTHWFTITDKLIKDAAKLKKDESAQAGKEPVEKEPVDIGLEKFPYLRHPYEEWNWVVYDAYLRLEDEKERAAMQSDEEDSSDDSDSEDSDDSEDGDKSGDAN